MLVEVQKKGELPIGKSKNTRKVYMSKAKFDLTLEELESFRLLQEYLYKQYFLYYYRMDKPLFVKIDACRKGYSAFVFQLKGHQDSHSIPGRGIPVLEIQPMLFLSWLTTNVEKKYGATESEVAAVVWVVRKIRKIIQSNRQPTNILTDYAATKGIVKHTSLNTIDLAKANLKLANAANWLSQFELNIFHVPRELNIVLNALLYLLTLKEEVSRDTNPTNKLVDIQSYIQNAYKEQAFTTNEASIKLVISKELKAQIVAAYPKDLKYSKVYQALTNDLAPINSTPVLKYSRRSRPCLLYGLYELKDNLLYYIDFDSTRHLYLPKSYIKPILKIVYNNKYYFSINKIIVDLNRLYFYKKLQIVRLFISYCKIYWQNQIDRSPLPSNYQPIRIPLVPFYTITIDFVIDLPPILAKGTFQFVPSYLTIDTLYTNTCKFSKKKLLYIGSKTFRVKEQAIVLLYTWSFADWGILAAIISDRDPKFTAELQKEVFGLLGTKLLFSIAYYPQTDGQLERTNQTVEIAIRMGIADNLDLKWTDLLLLLQYNLNNTLAVIIGRSPNELVYGF